MEITSPNGKVLHSLRANGVAEFKPPTTFTQNWQTAMHLNMYENMSTSRSRLMREYTQPRNKTILESVRTGKFPEREFRGFRVGVGHDGINWRLAAVRARQLGIEVETDDEILQRIRDDLDIYRKHAEDVFGRQSVTGAIGEFSGYAHTDMLDPLLMPGLFVGYGQAAVGSRFLATSLKTGIKIGAAEAGLELVRQFPVTDWKNDIGADYDVFDALSTIAMTGGFAFGLGTSAQAFSLGVRKMINQFNPQTRNQAEAIRAMEKVAREQAEAAQIEEGIPAVTVGEAVETEIARQENLIKDNSLPPDTSHHVDDPELSNVTQGPNLDDLKFAAYRIDGKVHTGAIHAEAYSKFLDEGMSHTEFINALAEGRGTKGQVDSQGRFWSADELEETLGTSETQELRMKAGKPREEWKVERQEEVVNELSEEEQLALGDELEAAFKAGEENRALYDGIDPESDIPTVEAEGEVQTIKLREVVDQEVDNTQKANRMKECLVDSTKVNNG